MSKLSGKLSVLKRSLNNVISCCGRYHARVLRGSRDRVVHTELDMIAHSSSNQVPVFLQNLCLETRLALEHQSPYTLMVRGISTHNHKGGPDFWLSLKILEAYGPAAHVWLDTHRIHDHPINRRIAGLMSRLWFLNYNWAPLLAQPEQSPGLTHTLAVAKRLIGFFPSLKGTS